jgi:hypothetical protein
VWDPAVVHSMLGVRLASTNVTDRYVGCPAGVYIRDAPPQAAPRPPQSSNPPPEIDLRRLRQHTGSAPMRGTVVLGMARTGFDRGLVGARASQNLTFMQHFDFRCAAARTSSHNICCMAGWVRSTAHLHRRRDTAAQPWARVPGSQANDRAWRKSSTISTKRPGWGGGGAANGTSDNLDLPSHSRAKFRRYPVRTYL